MDTNNDGIEDTRANLRPAQKMTATKAQIAAVAISVIGIATGLTEIIPDPTLGLVCKIIILVVGTVAGSFGVYQFPNKPKY